MLIQEQINVNTDGRGTYEVTSDVQQIVESAAVETGLCHVFIHHTSASLILCENADPSVRNDLERFMARIAPDGDPAYTHNNEGPDDMSAHIRTAITQTGLMIPVKNGRCVLGTWQGVYLWEHKARGRQRQLTITVYN
ncbi:MAG: YjbQ family protein [Gammaproteobacteria bacterium]|nr:YjbQ family protein [Gammaproteobacteria bacterium]